MRRGSCAGRRVRLARTWGDCYGYTLVATGQAEVMVDPQLNPWDSAAVVPIVEEAGGRFTDLDGRAVDLTTTSVLASNGATRGAM